MEMVANGVFHGNERPDVLAYTRKLWSTYSARVDVARLKLRSRPLDLLRQAAGLDSEDIVALTAASYGCFRALQPDMLPGVNAFVGIPISRADVENYLFSIPRRMLEA